MSLTGIAPSLRGQLILHHAEPLSRMRNGQHLSLVTFHSGQVLGHDQVQAQARTELS